MADTDIRRGSKKSILDAKIQQLADVPDWTKSPTKPTYTPAEVGALASDAKAVDSDKLDGYHASDLAASHNHAFITYGGVNSGVVSAQQTDAAYYGSPASWASYLIMNHGNGANYYHQMLRLSFFGGLQSQVMTGGTLSGWRTYLDSTNFLNYIYPVGSIYMSISSTSPATLFGGTWSAIYNMFLLGAGSSYGVGATGGAATHTLTIAEMPNHEHAIADLLGQLIASSYQGTTNNYRAGIAPNTGNSNWPYYIAKTGGGGAHNNMPPYYAVYMWRRTA